MSDFEERKRRVQELWDLSKEAEVELLRAYGMKPCPMEWNEDEWWYLPDEDDDGQSYARREACRLILLGAEIVS